MSDNTIRWEQDADGVVILTLDDPNQGANTMNEAYARSMAAAVARLEAEKEAVTGVILTSAKKTFFAGGDLNDLRAVTPERAEEFAAGLREIKGQLRRLETLGKPVVAAVNGTALGGGLEIALATHRRIVVDDSKIQLGFPEVSLGLLPGGGGVVRTVRMLGIVNALMQFLLQGKRVRPGKALELGIVDELVATRDDLIPAAKKWIAENPEAQQPWDADKKYKIPGGTPSTPALAMNLPAFPANLKKQLKGANYPAPAAIMAAAIEGAQVDFDSAIEIEGRYFVKLATGQVSKNMIQAFFFDLQQVNGDRGRPAEIEPFMSRKAVVLGAGMMGAAIAYVCAKAGIEVVLKDVDQAAAERGKDYSKRLLDKAVSRGRSTQEKADALLALITPTTDPAAAAGADLVIEAVFEDPAVKARVFAEIEPHLAPGALLGSNTSTLPITQLAEGVSRPADFIGLHFFSPVDKMPLLEIIKGEATSDETLYRALDVAKQIKKTPIVVNDSRGFFTSRVIGTFINEGISMLVEGIPAPTIEQASSQAGYPAPVLQLSDELNLKLMRKIRNAAKAANDAVGTGWDEHPSETVIDAMLDRYDRPGKLEGRGFYSYADGKRTGIWEGLAEAFPPVSDPSAIVLRDLEERMMFIEAIETIKCRDEGVIESVADANIGSIFGIGFPAWSGGVLQYVNGYEGGVAGFVARARELSAKYGDRFDPPASLVEASEKGDLYLDGVATPA
ncbi:3-hydroxyacyl-CoA dehydrogenase NAD-binding domain-containing protein [Conexibacter sp. JD483]|uniref:3-hydroxyacyl-CoA dehydrogenase NAD-binding domain-containing protein n=1 Tax=unclassified Conexibacter TaxID=2627773 RepID=UPI002716514B|nr:MULTISPECIES: 3-hydroxyacyl-CoA dehydrogenase NAD-binding domain-containing protein [unclassified Conexibacter]MDO8188194.1 3-hydroxyacyl-CoA dehydrogenase NAD-binding domain-containing protein [Conexibacter sp. CPCC 205706]MDO8201601.1 3-hydroxyacyl-CoA dehydrogenase NAD-binding domain-containing protein [Conexibacter sp. CPCC 205762]MDR9372751.1 3-hydroxyacyl-CoA dehydrogenase NAD-binding domain-containing protein [Conexibacter sp. JD483]